MSQTVNYYKILQIRNGAGREDITAAYRRLSKVYHPDVNANPAAEEIMKQINMAYSALCKGKTPDAPTASKAADRQNREADIQKAYACVKDYFSALISTDYARAYELLSNSDKKYVTFQSFCDWRGSVQKLFVIRDFSVSTISGVFSSKLMDGSEAFSISHMISITEKNTILQTVESYKISKLAIMEPDGWRVFLGYRDLSEIAKIFEDLSAKQEKGEMARHWQEYCGNTCRDLNMANLAGLLKKAEPEIYRCKRYRQLMTVACFRVKPVSSLISDELAAEAIESAAKIIAQSLRETDIPAYLGDGIFAVLFVELRKKHADLISQRLTNKLRSSIHKDLKMSIYADCQFAVFDGGELEDYIDRCSQFK